MVTPEDVEELEAALHGLPGVGSANSVASAVHGGGSTFEQMVCDLSRGLPAAHSASSGTPDLTQNTATTPPRHGRGEEHHRVHAAEHLLLSRGVFIDQLLGCDWQGMSEPQNRLLLLQLIASEHHAHQLAQLKAAPKSPRALATTTPTASPAAQPVAVAASAGGGSARAAAQQTSIIESIADAVGAPSPTSSETPAQLIERLCQSVRERAGQAQLSGAGTSAAPADSGHAASKERGPHSPLLDKSVYSAEQLARLAQLSDAMATEYEMRREVLLKRLDVQARAFFWTQAQAVSVDEMQRAFEAHRAQLPSMSTVRLEDVFSATDDLLTLQHARPASAECQAAAVKQVLIGRVPDRGGRASETYFAQETMQMQVRERQLAGRGGKRTETARGAPGRGGGNEDRRAQGGRPSIEQGRPPSESGTAHRSEASGAAGSRATSSGGQGPSLAAGSGERGGRARGRGRPGRSGGRGRAVAGPWSEGEPQDHGGGWGSRTAQSHSSEAALQAATTPQPKFVARRNVQ